MKTPVKPQVPGVTQSDDTHVEETSNETVSIPKAQLDALLARVTAIESAQQSPLSRRANPEADLPDQDDVDASTIKSPVLSKQGWILPTGFGANPVQKSL